MVLVLPNGRIGWMAVDDLLACQTDLLIIWTYAIHQPISSTHPAGEKIIPTGIFKGKSVVCIGQAGQNQADNQDNDKGSDHRPHILSNSIGGRLDIYFSIVIDLPLCESLDLTACAQTT